MMRYFFILSNSIKKGGYKMKRIKLAILVVLIMVLSFMLLSCGGGGVAVVIDVTTAKAQFVTWIGNQEDVPGNAVGNFLCTLNVGDVISSEDPTAEQLQQRQSDPVNEAGWLFYLDEEPGGFYPHPGRILAISQTGKIMYQEETEGWPKVNGQLPDVMKDPVSTRITTTPNDYTVYNPAEVLIPVGIIKNPWIIQWFFRIYGAVVIDGLTPSQNLYYEATQAHLMMTDAMNDLFGSDRVRTVAYPNNTSSYINSAVSNLVLTEKVNNITLYIIAHGSIEHVNMGGYSYSCANLKALMDTYPDVRFNLIIETCRGGSWKDYFQALGATGVPNLDMCITSTTRDKSAYPDWDYSDGQTDHNASEDEFVEFTSDFILQMEFWTATANWPTIQGLTSPSFPNNTLKLYYYCYHCVKNRYYPAAALPIYQSYVLTERTPILIQEPEIYLPY